MHHALKPILVIVLLILVVIFFVQNPWLINTRYAFHYFAYQSVPIPLVFIVLGAILTGAGFASAVLLIEQLRLKKRLRLQEKRLKEIEELAALRQSPLTEAAREHRV